MNVLTAGACQNNLISINTRVARMAIDDEKIFPEFVPSCAESLSPHSSLALEFHYNNYCLPSIELSVEQQQCWPTQVRL